jgi:signal transduction histidine kinase
MPQNILMITAIAGAENCAAVLSKQFGLTVETARSRKEGLAALRRREFSVLVVDQSLVEHADDGMDSLLKHAGLAIPLEINFAISGCGRVVREVRAALLRRDREKDLALSAAASSIRSELRDGLAGLLLQSQLALAEPGIPPQLSERLELLLELAASLRQRLDDPQPQAPAPLIRAHVTQAQSARYAATIV